MATFNTDNDFAPDSESIKRDNPLRESKKDDSKSNKKKSSSGPTPTASQAKKLCEPLPDMYRMAGMAIAMYDEQCGKEIVNRADDLGNSWLKLAESSPAFRKFLQRVNSASGLGAVLTAHAPIGIAIAAHHIPELFSADNGDDDTVSDDSNRDTIVV